MRLLFDQQLPERILDAPDIIDDFYLDLLDWGSRNVVAIALRNCVYLWAASDGSVAQLLSVDDETGPVTSVRWAPDGRHLAVGFSNSHVQLWDTSVIRLVMLFLFSNFYIVFIISFWLCSLLEFHVDQVSLLF